MEVGLIGELVLIVLQYCDMSTLVSCSLVNKQFCRLSRHDSIWNILVRKNFNWQYMNLPKEFDSYYRYHVHLDKTIRYHKKAKATIHELNSKYHPLLMNKKNLLSIDYIDKYPYKQIYKVIQKIKSYVHNMRKGDLIVYPEYMDSDNRNIFIYNGQNVEILTFNRDESKNGYCYNSDTSIGAIPIKYSIPDLYPLTYWGTEPWLCVPFDPYPFIEQLVNNYSSCYGIGTIDTLIEKIFGDSSHSSSTWFFCNHIRFVVVIDSLIPKEKLEQCFLLSSYCLHPSFDSNFTLLIDKPEIDSSDLDIPELY